MAQEIDPSRWKEFAPRRAPRRTVEGPPQQGAGEVPDHEGSDQASVTVRQIMEVSGSGVTVGALASVTVQVVGILENRAVEQRDVVQSGRSEAAGRPDQCVVAEAARAGGLLQVRVGADGLVECDSVPGIVAEQDLIALFARFAGDDGLPLGVRRLLRAHPAPQMSVIADQLGKDANIRELRRLVNSICSQVPTGIGVRDAGQSDADEGIVSEGGSVGVVEEASQGRIDWPDRSTIGVHDTSQHAPPRRKHPSPTARRRANGRESTHISDTNHRLATRVRSARVRMVIAAAVGAVGLVVVLGLAAGAASSSGSPVQMESAAQSGRAVEPGNTALVDSSAASGASAGSTWSPESGTEVKSPGPGAGLGWSTIVAELDARREELLRTRDLAVLDKYAVAGSAVAERDRGLVEGLRSLGASAVGVRSKIISVVEVVSRDGSATLEVTDQLAAYDVVRADSQEVIEHRPAGQVVKWSMILQYTGDGWKYVDARVVR